jgi:hypothetical protein
MHEVRIAQGDKRNFVREGERDQWFVNTAHYPKSLTKIPMLRVIICNGYGWVVAVTDAEEKKGKIIADCELRKEGEYGPYFTTYSYHRGHSELCRHLLSYGVGGRYTKYVEALDRDEKATAEELSGTAMIRFSTRVAKEEFEDWDIDMSFWEEEDDGLKKKKKKRKYQEEEED